MENMDTSNEFTDLLQGGASEQPQINPSPPPNAAPASASSVQGQPEENEFENILGGKAEKFIETSPLGAAARHAVGGILPAAGTLIGAGAGGAAGALLGGVGAFGGAVGGGIAGGTAAEHLQDWLMSKVPENWMEAIGQSKDQKQLDEMMHPYSSFVGGMVPFTVALSPTGGAAKLAGEGLTTFRKLLNNPVASRAVSGAFMGAFEAGSELVQGEAPDWRKVAISTGFGVVFNGSNKIGDTLHSIGRMPLAAPGEYIAGKIRGKPTLAALNDEGSIGPGVTLETMNGTEKRNPVAEQAARENYYKEYRILGGASAEENIHEIAKRQNPEIVEHYEGLQNDRAILEEWKREHEEEGNLSPEDKKWVDQNIKQVDADIEKLEPHRARAYRNAAARVPSSLVEEGINPAEVTPEVQQRISPPGRPIEDQRKFIAEDISKRLQTIGKDKELSDTQADLQSKYYAMRAYRFEGRRGTAEEFYRAESPGIAAHVEGLTRQNEKNILNPEQADYLKMTPHERAWSDLTSNKSYAENRESWKPGDFVNNKDIKNMVVLNKDANGQIELIGKPNKGGKSFTYLYDKNGKLSRSQKYVDFEKETSSLERPKEEVIEQRKSKKDIANGYIERLIGGKRSVVYLAEHANPSTFMHEMGHQWLVDLFNDANHPLAPEGLKNDANMVAKQLGIKDIADLRNIKRNQHEQFAKWTEQYLREGISPSRELDHIFSKFRNWMLSVYETLKGLGKPITPEIRAVFDRMLSEAPEPRVIVPEKPRGPTLSEIHEIDAEEAQPHPEAPEADRIDHEINRFIQDQPIEVKNEINEVYRRIGEALKSKGETGGGGGEPQEVDVGDELAGLIPEGETGRERGGAFHQIGEQNKEEIYRRLSGESDERISAGGIDDIAPILDENRDWSGLKKYRTDINPALENLTNDEDLKNFLDYNEKKNNEFDAFRRRTPLSPGDALNWADDFGAGEKDMKRMMEQSRIVAENVVPAKNLLKAATYRMKTSLDKWASTRDPKDALDAYAALQSQTMIQGYYMGFRSNAGRFLGNFRRIKAGLTNPENINTFLKDSAGMTLFQVEQALDRALLARNIPELSRFSREEAQPVKWGTMVHEFYSNNLRSNPLNQAYNAMSQAFDVAYSYGLVKPASVGIGKIASLLGQTGERRRLSELSVPFKELAKPTHYAVAKETFLTGNQLELPGENVKGANKDIFDLNAPSVVPTVKVNEYVTWKDIFSRANKTSTRTSPPTEQEASLAGTALLQSCEESIINGPENLQLQKINSRSNKFLETIRNPRGSIPDLRIGGINIPLGSMIRAPGERIDMPQSNFFASHTAISEKNMWAMRTAQEIADRENLTPIQRDKKAADLQQNPPPDKFKEFNDTARDMIYMGGSGKLSNLMTSIIDFEVANTGLKPLRFVVPFAKMSFQIANKAFMEGSVAGIASERVRNNILGKNGNIAQHDALAKMAVGMTMHGLYMWYATTGRITGAGPQDWNERMAWLADGHQPYSIKIGNTWVPYGSLGPLGKIIGMSADMYSILGHITENDIATNMKKISYAAGSLFFDESPFGALSNLSKALNDPNGKGTKLASSLLSNFAPYSSALRAVTKAIDPHMKDAETFTQNLVRGIPGLSYYVPNRVDIWGREQGFSHQESNDPVIAYPASAGFGMAAPDKKILEVPLTQDQHNDFIRITGQTAYSQLQNIVNSPSWATYDPQVKHQIYDTVFGAAKNAAAGQILRNNPDIIDKAKQIQIEKQKGEKK